MDPKTQHLLTAKPLPLLVRMAAPSTLAFLVQGSVSLAEVWFIGQLGSISLAAIALAFPFLMLTQTLSGGAMGGAVASAIARALGAGDIHRAEQLIWHALALGAAGALADESHAPTSGSVALKELLPSEHTHASRQTIMREQGLLDALLDILEISHTSIFDKIREQDLRRTEITKKSSMAKMSMITAAPPAAAAPNRKRRTSITDLLRKGPLLSSKR